MDIVIFNSDKIVFVSFPLYYEIRILSLEEIKLKVKVTTKVCITMKRSVGLLSDCNYDCRTVQNIIHTHVGISTRLK